MRIIGILLACGLVWGQGSADDLYKNAIGAAQKGDFAKAEFLLRDMRLGAPKDERWLAGLMWVLMQQRKPEAAIKIGREVGPQFGTSLTVHLQLGSALQQMERPDEALKEFEDALPLCQTNAEKASAYGLIGQAQWRLGKMDAAIAAYRKSKELSGPPNVVFAELLMGKGERDAAIAEFRAVLRVMPDNVAALNDLASTWAGRGENLDEALQFARQAEALRPSFALVTDTLARVYFKKGMLAEAEETMMRSLGQEGGISLSARGHLAAIMDAQGDWSGDRRELRKLLEGELSAGQLVRLKELLRK